MKKSYQDNDDEYLEQVLEKRQKWNIEEKLNQSNQFKGNFLQELTANGLCECFIVVVVFLD